MVVVVVVVVVVVAVVVAVVVVVVVALVLVVVALVLVLVCRLQVVWVELDAALGGERLKAVSVAQGPLPPPTGSAVTLVSPAVRLARRTSQQKRASLLNISKGFLTCSALALHILVG